MLSAPTAMEREIIGAFTYTPNIAVLHSDASFMPKRRKAWSSWNYLGQSGAGGGRDLCVTYWMNLLQDLPRETPLFVTLNPIREIDPAKVKPVKNGAAARPQASIPARSTATSFDR